MIKTEPTAVPWFHAEIDGGSGRLRVFYATSPEIALDHVEVTEAKEGRTRIALVLAIPVEDDGSPATVSAAEEWRCIMVAADLDPGSALEDAATGEFASQKDLGEVLGSAPERELEQLRGSCCDAPVERR